MQPTTINFDKLFDSEFQKTHGLPSANDLIKKSKDELQMINQKVTNAQKSTGGHKGTAARRK